MVKRTTLEFDPIIGQAVKSIANSRGLKIKFVSDKFMRYAIPRWESILANSNDESGAKRKPRARSRHA
jgi:hypothetical protein